jgi:hypothetical protein
MSTTSILEQLPPAVEIHSRLADALAEVTLCRALLRLRMKADEDRQQAEQAKAATRPRRAGMLPA